MNQRENNRINLLLGFIIDNIYIVHTLNCFMENGIVFYLFRAFQSLVFGFIAFFLLRNANVGLDTSLVLSILLTLSTFVVGYAMYSKK